MALMDSFFNNLQVLFGGFYTPVVLKRFDEGIQRQIAYYETHPSKENNKKLAGFKKGAVGEENVLFQLEHSGIGMFILHGVHVEDVQIDFVVVTRGWIYFIECKNWSGNWTICKDGTVLIKNGEKTISRPSPLAQNQRHMDAVKQRWRQKNSKVVNVLFSSLFEKSWYKPLVVISNYESTVNLDDASEYDKTHIVRADLLVDFIKKDLRAYSRREPFYSKKGMKSIADSFLKAEEEYQEKYVRQKTQEREKSQPPSVSANWKQSQEKFKKNLQDFCRQQGKLENKSPSQVLTNQDIYIICLHDYSNPNELEKVAISKAKKEKYGKAIIAAYDDAFRK